MEILKLKKFCPILLLMLVSTTSFGQWSMPNNFQDIDPTNPNGQWSYGWSPVSTWNFQLLDSFYCYSAAEDSPTWYHLVGSTKLPALWKNTGSDTHFGVDPQQISLHPGPNGESAVLRWTSPLTGKIKIQGQFYEGDFGAPNLFIVQDSNFNNPLLHQANCSINLPFDFETVVDKNGTLDFLVCCAFSGCNVPLDVNISFLEIYKTKIYVDENASGSNNGISWNNAYIYLQDALANADKGDEILVAQGIYSPDQGDEVNSGDREVSFCLVNGVEIYGGYAGITESDPDERNLVEYKSILSGDLSKNDSKISNPFEFANDPNRIENSYHVVKGSDTDETAILDGFVITGGFADDENWPNSNGGGMINCSGKPTILNCTFQQNYAISRGGAVSNDSSSFARIMDCFFFCNYANIGGAILNNGQSK
ncbi:MAG: hypothetical protein JXD22_00485 [Sedimentisphaerales bacterium]|nr:hypothetical protein [Sedimentisphaerales bacterium]